MDDVGRLWQGLLILIPVSLALGFLTACGNGIMKLSDSEARKLSENSEKSRKLEWLKDHPDVITQTNLAVRTVAIITLSALGTEYIFRPVCADLKDFLSGGAYAAACAATAAAVILAAAVIFSSLSVCLPKKLAMGGKIGGRFAARPVNLNIYAAFILLFCPVRFLISAVSSGTARLAGVKREDEEEQITEEAILEMLDQANEDGGIGDGQAEMISNIFEFSDMELHEVMTHRTQIAAVETGTPVSGAVKLSLETGFSRIPVYEGSVDNICGVIYIKDMLAIVLNPGLASDTVDKYFHEIKFVPEYGSCSDLFRYFTENKKQIAVALDEYGGTAGIVTMEDLLECIVGNICDEYDENETEDIQEISPDAYDINGKADPDDVMRLLGHTLPDGHDYDTIGGFLTDILGYIPENGQTPAVKWNDVTFCVIKAGDNRIEKIRAIKGHKKKVLLDEE